MIPTAAAMAAMMAPTAVPFFVAYARDGRRPAAAAALIAVYMAVWAMVGVAAHLAMSLAMPPVYMGALAIAGGVAWSATPWARRAAARCRDMCLDPPGAPLPSALAYSASCIVCSAGAMVAVMALGMDSAAWLAAGSCLVLVYKTVGGGLGRPVRQPIRES